MKPTLLLFTALTTVLGFAAHAAPTIIAGPITNPANGHDYYLLTPDTWTAAETAAENLGGTLTTIRSDAEQEWVFATFSAYDKTNHPLWIGLRRTFPGGPFTWVTGEKPDYSHWARGNPDNAGGNEMFVHIYPPDDPGYPGTWNDAENSINLRGAQPCGIVELPGKGQLKAINTLEKSLVGTWYEHGDSERTCWIAGADKALFAIDHDRNTSRLLSLSDDKILAVHWQQRGEVDKDRILWSKGNWWSRKPSD